MGGGCAAAAGRLPRPLAPALAPCERAEGGGPCISREKASVEGRWAAVDPEEAAQDEAAEDAAAANGA